MLLRHASANTITKSSQGSPTSRAEACDDAEVNCVAVREFHASRGSDKHMHMDPDFTSQLGRARTEQLLLQYRV